MEPISHLFSTFRTTARTFFAENSKAFTRVALAVGGVAACFFAMGRIANKWFNSSEKPFERPRGDALNHLSTSEQKETETIRKELLELLDRTDAQWATPGQKEQYERLKALFTGEGSLISSVTIQEGRTFLNALRPQSSGDIINQQNEQYEKARLEDQLKEMQKAKEKAMQQEIKELQSKISKATKALEVQINSLEPYASCWAQLGRVVSLCNLPNFSENENSGEFFSQIETRHVKQEKQVDTTLPNDCFKEQVLSLYSQFPEKEGVFASAKESLHSTYETYLGCVEKVKERLAWVRLRNYHFEVGEEFLKSQLNLDLLKKIREGEELPRPVTATSSSERSEGKQEIKEE